MSMYQLYTQYNTLCLTPLWFQFVTNTPAGTFKVQIVSSDFVIWLTGKVTQLPLVKYHKRQKFGVTKVWRIS